MDLHVLSSSRHFHSCSTKTTLFLDCGCMTPPPKHTHTDKKHTKKTVLTAIMSAVPHFKVSVDGRKATIYLERSFKVDCGFKHNQNTKNTRGKKVQL